MLRAAQHRLRMTHQQLDRLKAAPPPPKPKPKPEPKPEPKPKEKAEYKKGSILSGVDIDEDSDLSMQVGQVRAMRALPTGALRTCRPARRSN